MNTLRFISITLFLVSITATSWAQGVAVNATGNPPDGSAMLDVSSINGGVLVPRMTRTQRDAISSPATGLMVFQTTDTTGFYYYNGSSWEPLGAEALSIDDLIEGKYDGSSLSWAMQPVKMMMGRPCTAESSRK